MRKITFVSTGLLALSMSSAFASDDTYDSERPLEHILSVPEANTGGRQIYAPKVVSTDEYAKEVATWSKSKIKEERDGLQKLIDSSCKNNGQLFYKFLAIEAAPVLSTLHLGGLPGVTDVRAQAEKIAHDEYEQALNEANHEYETKQDPNGRGDTSGVAGRVFGDWMGGAGAEVGAAGTDLLSYLQTRLPRWKLYLKGEAILPAPTFPNVEKCTKTCFVATLAINKFLNDENGTCKNTIRKVAVMNAVLTKKAAQVKN